MIYLIFQLQGVPKFWTDYQLPISVITGMFILWGLSTYLFPHLPSFSKWLAKDKDARMIDMQRQIVELKTSVDTLQEKYDELKAENEHIRAESVEWQAAFNRLFGTVKGLSYQLKSLDIDIEPELRSFYALFNKPI